MVVYKHTTFLQPEEKVKQLKNIFLLLFIITVLFGCHDNESDNTAQKTTFMVYMIGSNLESDDFQASFNINEMLSGTEDDTNTTIILQTGAAKHSDSDPENALNILGLPLPIKDWTTIQLHKIHNGKLETLDNNMGKSCFEDEQITNCVPMSKNNIASFIEKAAKYAPADRYILVLWDHGSASIVGYGDKANLSSVIDIKNAIRRSGVHFDIIGFDACLMNTLETAYSLKDYADYFIASEELESGQGWNYEDFLKKIADNNAISSKEIAEEITEAFHNRYTTEEYKDENHTLSAIDLKQIEDVKISFESYTKDMFTKISSGPNHNTLQEWTDFNYIRKDTEYYGEYYRHEILHIDIQDLVKSLSGNDFGINKAVQNAVISNKTDRPNSNGLSIFMPYYYDNKHVDEHIKKYNELYKDILPNSVNFAKKLIETAKGGLDGDKTITGSNTKVDISASGKTTYSGNVESDYGFREINILAYYIGDEQIIGTPFIESKEPKFNDTKTKLDYKITTGNGILEFTDKDGKISLTPYAVDADIVQIDNQPRYEFAFPIFYADTEGLECMDSILQSNPDITDKGMQEICDIDKFVMRLTLDKDLKVIDVDRNLEIYNDENRKQDIELKAGEAVFLNSATIESGEFSINFDRNNKFIIQDNITDTFKVSLKEDIDTNDVKFILFAINHAGGRKIIYSGQDTNAEINTKYMQDAETILQAYTPKP